MKIYFVEDWQPRDSNQSSEARNKVIFLNARVSFQLCHSRSTKLLLSYSNTYFHNGSTMLATGDLSIFYCQFTELSPTIVLNASVHALFCQMKQYVFYLLVRSLIVCYLVSPAITCTSLKELTYSSYDLPHHTR